MFKEFFIIIVLLVTISIWQNATCILFIYVSSAW